MRRNTLPAIVLASCLVILVRPDAIAEVKLPAVVGDSMVIQQGASVPIWGWAQPGEAVSVSIAGQKKAAAADGNGRWMVHLDPLEAGGPLEMTVSGANTITIRNILVGEVWLAAGQSNMRVPVRQARDAAREIADAHYPQIRLLSVPNVAARTPQSDFQGKWAECGPESVERFSAVAYFFARELYKDIDIPIGVIDASWSGSVAEAWMSPSALGEAERISPLVEELLAHWKRLDDDWAARHPGAMGSQTEARDYEDRKIDPALQMHHPSAISNGVLAPLVPFAIGGVIWYQGEGNSGRAFQYRTLFPALINDWRARWGQGDFPFLFVQLANYRATRLDPEDSNWAELREAQSMTLSLPNTGMAAAVDAGEADNVHPRDKQTVGHRLALVARALVYGERIVYSGPMFESARFKSGKAVIKFKFVGGGLVAKGGPLRGFAVAGEDRNFVWANAVIEGDTVAVSSSNVAKPAAVRYAWQDNPVCNLYNEEGLPASPFRTDDWPGITAGIAVEGF